MTVSAAPGRSSDSLSIDAVCGAHAARLTRRTETARLVLLTAPTGFGKTVVADRIAAQSGLPTAWCTVPRNAAASTLWVDVCRAVSAIRPDAPPTAADLSPAEAERLLGRCLDIVGETMLVLDDVDHLEDDVVEAAITMLATFGALRIVVTAQHVSAPSLTSLEAAGQLIRLTSDDLGFSSQQCIDLTNDARFGTDLFAATGGWPIAVLLAVRNHAHGMPSAATDSLLHRFLQAFPTFDRQRLAIAARLDVLPDALAQWLQPAESIRRDPVVDNLLFEQHGAVTSLRQWAREALGSDPIDELLAAEAIALVRTSGKEEIWITLAIEAGRLDLAEAAAERCCAELITSGRHDRARRLIERIPPEQRSVDIQISAVLAAQATTRHRPTEQQLHDLVRHSRHADGSPSPRASAALANHLRMVGDPAVVGTCHDVVAPLIGLDPDAAASTARSCWPALPDRIAAGELLRLLGQGTMFLPGPDSFGTGLQMVRCALRILEEEHSVRSQQGWLLYIEAMMFVEHPSKVVYPARTIAIELWRSRHSDAPLRLSELAVLEFFSGSPERTRSTIELARTASVETGNDLAVIPLVALDAALDVLEQPDATALVEAFDRAILELLDHDFLAGFHQLFAAEFGLLQLRLGQTETARRFCEIAEQSPDTFMSASFALRRRRLRALLTVVDDAAAGRAELDELRQLAIDLGRPALVEMIDDDLAEAHSNGVARTGDDGPLRISALGPAFSLSRDDIELPAPSGYSAKLLALLVASAGVVAIDVVLETLWPDTDPRVSRNRLHGVLLRLRRTLGFAPDGPLTCRDELVRLEAGPDLQCDAWDVEQSLAAGHPVPVFDDLLSEQFRYDDRVSVYRDTLRGLAAAVRHAD